MAGMLVAQQPASGPTAGRHSSTSHSSTKASNPMATTIAPHDWAIDVTRYVSNADNAAVNGIVKHLGIGLQTRDGSFVACADKSERDRVRESFLKKKLTLSLPDTELDQVIMEVCQRMKADRDK